MRVLLQRRHRRLDQEGQWRQVEPPLLGLALVGLAERFHGRDIGLVVVGDVGDGDPVAVQVAPADPLDPRKGHLLDLAECAEVDLRQRRHFERRGRRRRRRPVLQGRLDEGGDVFAKNAAFATAALHLQQVHTQFAGEHADGRAGIGNAARHGGFRAQRHGRRSAFAGARRLRPGGRLGHGRRRLGLGRWRWGGGFRLRWRLPGRLPGIGIRLEDGDHVALGDRVVETHPEFGNHAGRGRGHLHGGLVALQRDQRLLGRHAVAGGDQHLDHRHVGEVADVGNPYLDAFGHAQAPSGYARSGSMPNRSRAASSSCSPSSPSRYRA